MSAIKRLLAHDPVYVVPEFPLRGETAEKFKRFIEITGLPPAVVAAAILDETVAKDPDLNAVVKSRKTAATASKAPPAAAAKPGRVKRPQSAAQKLAARVAALKHTVTGKVYLEFSQRYADKLKKMDKDDVKAARLAWLKAEAARLGKGKR